MPPHCSPDVHAFTRQNNLSACRVSTPTARLFQSTCFAKVTTCIRTNLSRVPELLAVHVSRAVSADRLKIPILATLHFRSLACRWLQRLMHALIPSRTPKPSPRANGPSATAQTLLLPAACRKVSRSCSTSGCAARSIAFDSSASTAWGIFAISYLTSFAFWECAA